MRSPKHILISSLSVAMLALLAVALTSCTEDVVGSQVDDSGTPEITGVRYVDAAAEANPERIGPGDWVALLGNNMDATTNVYFVGVEASFNPALMTDKSLVVQVPTEIPFGSMDPAAEVMNTIEVTNSRGSSVLDFPVVPPGPQVNSISNEFAHGGQSIRITGQYLYLVEEVVFPGGFEADAGTFEWAGNGTWMEVTVPTGFSAEEGGALEITTLGGSSTSLPVAGFHNGAGMLNNFDDVNNCACWSVIVEDDAAVYPDGWGSYGRLQADEVAGGDWGWWNPGRSLNLNEIEWMDPANLSDQVGAYALKFEINVQAPMDYGTIMIRAHDDWPYIARFEPWTDSGNTYQPDGWKTETIPLTEFRSKADDGTDGAGPSVPSLRALLGDDAAGVVGFMYVNDDEDVAQTLDLAIDNVRVVKIR